MPDIDPEHESSTDQKIREFQRGGQFVLGAGEELDDLQANGEWLSTDNPVDLEGSR
jgi:hypothetical protein